MTDRLLRKRSTLQFLPWLISVLCILLNAGIIRADDLVIANMVPLGPVRYSTTFTTDNRWSVEVLGTALGDVTNRHVVMGGLTTGVGFYVFDNVAIQMDLTGYGFSEGRSDGAAVGISLGIRHHIFNIASNSVFLDVAGGEIEASNNIPYGGTHLNNTIQFGVGVAHPIANNLYLIGGVRYFHISNASSEGGNRNPSVNAIQGVIGVMWRF